MKSDQDYQELESRCNAFAKGYVAYKYLAMFFFFVFVCPKMTSVIVQLMQDNSSITAPVTLFDGLSGNLNIKTVNYETSENENIIKEQILNDVQWAKLELWPTIGCAKPVLVYLDDNHNVNRLPVDEAKIIK